MCTPEEIEEGGKLALTETHGGGSTWKAIGCSVIALGGGFLSLWFRVAPGNRLWLVVGVPAFVVLVMVLQKLMKRKTADAPLELEINEDGIRLAAGESSTTFSAASIEKLIESETLFALRCKALLIFLPKRVFASDAERDGFRTLAAAWSESRQEPDVQDRDSAEDPTDAVSVEFRLRFRDYVDRTLASWSSRALSGLFLLITLGTFVYGALQPVPGAVVSPAEILMYFMPPVLIIQTLFLLFVHCVHSWFNERPHRCDMRVAVSDRGVEHATDSDRSMTAWSVPTRFKESPRSFYVWWPGTRVWLMLPKRAFASAAEIQQCRALLATHAEESTWFWS